MWLTLNMIMCYAFINLIQKHHLYNKDQNNFKITSVFFILSQVFRYHTSRKSKHLTPLFPTSGVPFPFVFCPYWCLTGQAVFSLRDSWLCISELCFTPWLRFVNCAIHSYQCGGITPHEERVQPSMLHAGNSLEMASWSFPTCAFSHTPCSEVFLIFLSFLVHICSDLLIPYFFSHGHFCLLG